MMTPDYTSYQIDMKEVLEGLRTKKPKKNGKKLHVNNRRVRLAISIKDEKKATRRRIQKFLVNKIRGTVYRMYVSSFNRAS